MNKPVIKKYISSLSPLKKKTVTCGGREGKKEREPLQNVFNNYYYVELRQVYFFPYVNFLKITVDLKIRVKRAFTILKNKRSV